MGDLWCFDTKVIPTLRLLVGRPGALTTEYLAGRRVRQVPPFKLFLFLAFLLGVGFLLQDSFRQPTSVSAILKIDTPHERQGSWTENLEHKSRSNPADLSKEIRQRIIQSTFVLVPAFAGILALIYRKRKRPYAEHLVFALHLHAFAFLSFLGGMLLNALPWHTVQSLGNLVTFLLPGVYLFMALRHVHGEPRPKTLFKFSILAVSHGSLVLVLLCLALYAVAVIS